MLLARAPLAMIGQGYTPSNDPLETMIDTFSMTSGLILRDAQMQPLRLGTPAILAADFAGRTLGPSPYSSYSWRMNLTTSQ